MPIDHIIIGAVLLVSIIVAVATVAAHPRSWHDHHVQQQLSSTQHEPALLRLGHLGHTKGFMAMAATSQEASRMVHRGPKGIMMTLRGGNIEEEEEEEEEEEDQERQQRDAPFSQPPELLRDAGRWNAKAWEGKARASELREAYRLAMGGGIAAEQDPGPHNNPDPRNP